MYRITASADHHGTRIDTSTAEYLGESWGELYATEEDALRVAAELQGSVEDYDLDPSTLYEVEETPCDAHGDEVDSVVSGDGVSHHCVRCGEEVAR